MEPIPHTFKSVHDYLDFLYKDKEPSLEELTDSRKAYWRSYNTNLKKKFREKNVEYSIFFSEEELRLLRECMKGDQYVSRFIKKQILFLLSNNAVRATIDLTIIEQQLFLIVDYLEEVLDAELILDNAQIMTLKQEVKQLQEKIHKSFDNKN